MAKIKQSAWHHGLTQCLSGEVVWAQRTPDGWFAKVEEERGKLMILSGPWTTQREAECNLIDAAVRVMAKKPFTYYRVTTKRDAEMAGAGIGYEEIYGSEPRYYRFRIDAEAHAAVLNETSDELNGTYFVEERTTGQDDDDDYYHAQIR